MMGPKILENIRGNLVLQMEYLQATETAGGTPSIGGRGAGQPWGESPQIREIRKTILRIDRGWFGICSRCCNVIDAKLLLRMPVNQLCEVCRVRIDLRRGYRGRCVPGRKIPDDPRL